MANGYTFEREGEGYRFYSEDEADRAQVPAQPFISGAGPVLLAILGLVAGLVAHSIRATVLCAVAAGGLIYWKITRAAAPVAEVPTPRRSGTYVTTASIITARGETIPASRINSIDIKNEMDAANASFAGSRSYYRAGSGRAAMSAIGHDVRTHKAKTRYLVSIQHGSTDTVLAKRLSESGANGLRADVQRVLQGQALE